MDIALDATYINLHSGLALGRIAAVDATRFGYIGDGSESESFNGQNEIVSPARNGKYYTGKLDDLRMWNTVRTQSEIAENMNRRLSGCEEGLELYFDFNEGGGGNIFDKSNHVYALFNGGNISYESENSPIEKCTNPSAEVNPLLVGIDGYRYGFNGMEKDDEVKGSGNSYDFGARMQDSRLGRWLAIDPLFAKFPSHSAYGFAINKPLVAIDIDGRDIVFVINKADQSVDSEIQVQNFETVLYYLNSTEKGRMLISEYMASEDKNLYFVIGDAAGVDGLGEYLPYKSGEEYGKTPTIVVGDNAYFKDPAEKEPFDYTVISIPDSENHYIILDEELFDDEVLEVFEAKKASKVAGHEIGAHANNPQLNNEESHEVWGQTGIGHSTDEGEDEAKILNS